MALGRGAPRPLGGPGSDMGSWGSWPGLSGCRSQESRPPPPRFPGGHVRGHFRFAVLGAAGLGAGGLLGFCPPPPRCSPLFTVARVEPLRRLLSSPGTRCPVAGTGDCSSWGWQCWFGCSPGTPGSHPPCHESQLHKREAASPQASPLSRGRGGGRDKADPGRRGACLSQDWSPGACPPGCVQPVEEGAVLPPALL